MFVVALAELAGTVEEEAPKLAADVGVGVYEARLLLAGDRPKVVLRTPDEARARALLAKLRERRHGAIACDTRAVLRTSDMTALEDFRLSETSLFSASGEELPFSDLLAVLRAVRSEHTVSTRKVEERQIRIGAAIATGGLVFSKKVTTEAKKSQETREQVLYFFRKSGARAWVLREGATRFEGLGADMAPSIAENFVRFVAELKRRAPDAVFDDRLVRFHAADAHEGDAKLDEQAHLLALAIARLGRGPYR